jgi:drug/metabolite transporter (DMT)-like permease
VILASFFWAAGNVAAKTAGKVDMLAFTVWSSLIPPLPLFLLSLVVDGPEPLAALAHPSLKLIVSVLVLAYAGTVFGYGLWAGCFHTIRRRRSRPSRCWCRSSAWSGERSCSASRCARLSLAGPF